jgi:glycosyltransferase involved in cell wall biosynthesis
MKAIIVAPHFYPRIGGVEIYALNIANQLVTLGWNVAVITSGEQRDVTRTSLGDLAVYRLPIAVTVSNTPVGVTWRRRLRRIFTDEQPDVVNAHTPVPYLADVAQRASRSIPFVLTYHNDLHKDAIIPQAIVRTLQRTVIDRTLSRSTKIIATSDYYVRESPYLKRHEPKISIVPPGVDLATFNPEVQVSAVLARRYAGNRVILFVGSLNRSQQYKGLDLLISALGRIHGESPDLRLVIAGEGDGLDQYRKSADAAGVADHVDFPGYVAHDQLAQYYKLAQVFAMPSTSRTEGFGLVYLEAGAVGTPVIGSAIGGVPYSVRHNETGLLVKPDSVDDLCVALRRLVDNDALARRLGQAGAARARAEFDWRTLGERTSQILKDVCASKHV